MSRRTPRATQAGVRYGCGSSSRARLRWPVLRQRHVPIGRGPGGVASSLSCGTVSNAIEAPKAPRGVGVALGPTSRPAFSPVSLYCYIFNYLSPRINID